MSEVELYNEEFIKKPTISNLTCSYVCENIIFFGNEKGGVFKLSVFEEDLVYGSNKIRKIGCHKGKVICMVYHPELMLLFSGSSDHSIKVWKVWGRGELVQTLTNHCNTVLCINYIGDTIISGSIDRTFKFFQVEKERVKSGLNPWFRERKFFDIDGLYKTKDWITCIWSEKKINLYPFDVIVGDDAGNLIFLNSLPFVDDDSSVKKIEVVKKKKFQSGITSIQLNKKYLILSFLNNSIFLFDPLCKIEYKILKWKHGTINKLLYNPPYDELIIINDEVLFFYGFEKYNIKKRRKISNNKRTKLVEICLVNENEICCQSTNGVKLFSVRRTVPFKKFQAHRDPIVGLTILSEKEKDLMGDTTLEDEKTIMVCSQDSTISFFVANKYELKLQKKIVIKKDKNSEVFCYYFLPPCTILTGNNQGYICFLNTKKKKQVWYKPHSNTCSALHAIRFRGKKNYFLISGDFDGNVVKCDLTFFTNLDREPLFEKKFKCSTDTIIVIKWSDICEYVIIGDGSGNLGFLTLEFECVKTIKKAHKRKLTDIKVDGYLCFTSSNDCCIKQWDMKNFNCLRTFHFHYSEVNCFYIIPDSTEIISSDRESLVKWDYKKGKVLKTLPTKKGLEITVINMDENCVYCGTTNGMILKLLSKLFDINKKKEYRVNDEEYDEESEKKREVNALAEFGFVPFLDESKEKEMEEKKKREKKKREAERKRLIMLEEKLNSMEQEDKIIEKELEQFVENNKQMIRTKKKKKFKAVKISKNEIK